MNFVSLNFWSDLGDVLVRFVTESGFAAFFMGDGWKNLIMIAVACVCLYLAIGKKYEPLLLVPISFGMLLSNLPLANLMGQAAMTELPASASVPDLYNIMTEYIHGHGAQADGLLRVFYNLKGIFPSLIFMGVGAMTDFGPLIANPKSLLLGAAAQAGIFVAFLGALLLGWLVPGLEDFDLRVAASIGIIGGADGPTAILTTSRLAPDYLAPIAVAAYSYMALVPVIQPPIMRALTTKEERKIRMDALRPVSQKEKILFPIVVTILVILILPDTAPLIGMLMLGNLAKECMVTRQLADTASNALMYIVTIMLGMAVGASAEASTFLTVKTLGILALGVFAFMVSTAIGVLLGKVMCKMTGGKINPLIGAAGVSAVPMAARVAQNVGKEEDPTNFLLMHAMGPNVAGVIGSAVAAGVFLKFLQ
jgi:oxaloacetate decarboxylase beta subunit